MTQFFYYKKPGDWTVDLGNQVARLGDYGGYAMKAEAGGVGTSTFVIDDPNGTVGHSGDDILGLQQFLVNETDCAAQGADGVNGMLLYGGFIRERIYRRGSGPRTSLITGPAREIEMSLEDANAFAGFRIMRDSSTPLTGTVSKTNGSTTITGSGTTFLTQVDVGSTISIPGGGATDTVYVASVASNTSLTVVTAPTHSASGQTATRIDANRPAETDVQRVQWLISGRNISGSPYFYATNDAGWIDTSGGVNMDACDYTGQTPADVLHDCALASGKNWWLTVWEPTGTVTLWYRNSNSSTTYSSLLRISNVLADVDQSTTWYPVTGDAQLRRDPARTFAGVFLPHAAGHVYVTNATTGNTYYWRDGSAPTPNVKTQAQATANANRLLIDASTEEDRITCSVQLPSSLATGIKAGQRVQAKFSHLPGYSDWSWMRVVSLNVVQDVQSDKLYTLSMELSPQVFKSCSTVLSAIIAASANSSRDTSAPTVSITPTAGLPVVILEYTTAIDTNTPTNSGYVKGSAFTEIDHYDPIAGGAGNTAPLVGVAYRAISSPTGAYTADATYTVGCCSTADNAWRQIAVAVQTSSTTPVQSAIGNRTAGPVSLPADPTPGNLLLMSLSASTLQPSPAAAGWTLINKGPAGGGAHPSVGEGGVWARCIATGDGRTWEPDNASGVIVQLTEWALT